MRPISIISNRREEIFRGECNKIIAPLLVMGWKIIPHHRVRADAPQLPGCWLHSLTAGEGRAEENKGFLARARLNGRGIATLQWDRIPWFLQNRASHAHVMGHWDLVRWKQKMSFPPQPLPFQAQPFVFSLFLLPIICSHCLLLVQKMGEETQLTKCSRKKFAEGHAYEITHHWENTFSGPHTQIQGW